MKKILNIISFAILTGCTTQSTPTAKPTAAGQPPVMQFIATGAKITHVDAKLGFVVLDYRSQTMPAVGERLSVYRTGQRIGEVQITDPVRVSFATADILKGEIRVGDEAR